MTYGGFVAHGCHMTTHRVKRHATSYSRSYRTSGHDTVTFEVRLTDGPDAGRLVEVTMPTARAEWLAECLLETVAMNRNDVIRDHLARS